MAHPVPNNGFLWISPEVAKLSQPGVKTHPPPPVPLFLLAQNLSPKDIAGIPKTWSPLTEYVDVTG